MKHEAEFIKASAKYQENTASHIPYYIPVQPTTFKSFMEDTRDYYTSSFRSFTSNIGNSFSSFSDTLFGRKDPLNSYLSDLGKKTQFSTGYETARGIAFNYKPSSILPEYDGFGRRIFHNQLEASLYESNKQHKLGLNSYGISDRDYDQMTKSYGFGVPYEWRDTAFVGGAATATFAAGYGYLRAAPFASGSIFSNFAAAASSFVSSGLRFVPRAFASLLPGIGQVMTAMTMVMTARSAFAYATSHVSPLVLDLNDDGVKLYNIKQGVYFDYYNDGIAKRVGWISEHDGFLARDLDGNGRIDLIAELFGNDFMPAFLKLSILDTNNDNIIDQHDRDFSQLLIWQDANKNGLSEYDEVHDLAHHKITKIYLNKQRINESREGNYVVDKSEFEYEDGRKAEILDVLFENDPMDSYFVGKPGEDDEVIISPEILQLPNLRGFGKLPELWIAMSKDAELKNIVKSFMALTPNEVHDINETFKKIIFRWARTHEELPQVRGDINIDPQELKFIEMFTAQTFKQLGVAKVVGQHASDALSLGYKRIFSDLMSKLSIQSILKDALPKAKYLVVPHQIELGSSLDEAITTAKAFAEANGYGEDFWALFSRAIINSHADLGLTNEEVRAKIFEKTGYRSWLDAEGNIVGDNNDNTLDGTEIGDKIYGRSGNDKLSGKEGDDHVFGEDGDDYLAGDNGLDRLHGGDGADELRGGNDRDFLYGNEGRDRLYGEDGDDHLDGGSGDDFIDGGDGDDTLSFGDSKSKVRADLKLGKAYVGENEIDEFVNCENIGGSEQDDYFVGDDNDNHINGEGGDDELHGGKGDDTLFGATGNDVMYGEEGDDRLVAFTGSDFMDGGDGLDTVSYLHSYLKMGVKVNLQTGKGEGGAAEGDRYVNIENIEGSRHDDVLIGDKQDNILHGGEGNDEIYGAGGNDILNGGAGSNILYGEDGDDIFVLGDGSNKIFGGLGDDIISYEHAKKGVKIDMVAGISAVTAIYQDSFSEIENVRGSNFADVIIGNDGDNIISSLDGDDIVSAGAGNDRIIGGEGSDKIDGGAGYDFVDYSREARKAININLAKKVFKGGFAEGDQLINVENIIATKFDDILIGDDNNNQLNGLGGDDNLYGGAGNDILIGGSGKNHLYGEDGNDIFFLGEGENHVKGGSGVNGVNYKYAGSKVAINLVEQRAKIQDLVVDVYEDIRDATGSQFDDIIIGSDAGHRLRGEGGDDYIQAGGWNSYLDGGTGNNTLIGGKGNDVFHVSQGSNNIKGENGKDTLDYSEIGQEKYYDLVEREFLIRSKNNILPLSANQNYSNPVLTGEGLVVDLTLGLVTKPNQLVDKFVGIENITGTHFDDVIAGDDGDNVLDGSGGNDTIKAGGGNDVLVSGYGNSSLYGEDGDDEFQVIEHGMANIYGGIGNDLVFLFSYHQGISIDLNNGYIIYDDNHVRFDCKGIENITATKFADVIYDSAGDNIITGGDGDNVIHVSDGNDIIIVGSGRDKIHLNGNGDKRITGGYGGNKYIIGSNFQSNKFASTIITDFMVTGAKDVVDLSAYQMISNINDIKIVQLYEQDLKFAHITIVGNKELFLFDIEVSKINESNFIFYGQVVENNDFSI